MSNKLKFCMAIVASLWITNMQAQDMRVTLWDNATAPHANKITEAEKLGDEGRISQTSSAELFIYEAAADKATGKAVVICPGGGYVHLAMKHEGHDFAKWFAQNGITAAVLKYRMPTGVPEVPMEDAAEALRYMKNDYKGAMDIEKIGIMGFSAGGHLAASTGVGALKANGDASERAALRPDFMALFYPVITHDKRFSHGGSYNNLLGSDRTDELSAKWSPEKVAGKDAPATIFFHSDNDGVSTVNSALLYIRLKELGIKSSMHIYPTGGHGWGFRDTFPYKAQWQASLLDWLSQLK